MALTSRLFVFGPNGTLYRLGAAKFMEMLGGQNKHRFSIFAGQRVRAADVIVEFEDRWPVRIVRTNYDILPFDSRGYLDTKVFGKHQIARMDKLLPTTGQDAQVVDAVSLFVSRGGKWSPSRETVATIHAAALGHTKCKRL